jgi:hypothetical protein
MALVWATALVLIMRMAASTAAKVVCLNLAVAFVTLGALETWATAITSTRSAEAATYDPASYQRDDVLGVAPSPHSVVRSTRRRDGEVIFDATYTIGPDRLRVVPPSNLHPPDACVLFFGDSFIYGEGLADEQTLPFRVAVLGEGRYQVYNFGFHGYGPHQMLSALEHGRVAEVIRCRPTQVIFQSLTDHVARAAGVVSWARHHPRYRLQPDGTVRYDGHFDDGAPADTGRVTREVREQMAKSGLYRWLSARHRKVNADDLRLYVGIVSQARRDIEAAYPGCSFDVLLWAQSNGEVGATLPGSAVDSALRAAGITPRIVEQILPAYAQDSASYAIPFDGHPNARANDLLAHYVVQSILRSPSAP